MQMLPEAMRRGLGGFLLVALSFGHGWDAKPRGTVIKIKYFFNLFLLKRKYF